MVLEGGEKKKTEGQQERKEGRSGQRLREHLFRPVLAPLGWSLSSRFSASTRGPPLLSGQLRRSGPRAGCPLFTATGPIPPPSLPLKGHLCRDGGPDSPACSNLFYPKRRLVTWSCNLLMSSPSLAASLVHSLPILSLAYSVAIFSL